MMKNLVYVVVIGLNYTYVLYLGNDKWSKYRWWNSTRRFNGICGRTNVGIGTTDPANGSKLHIRDGYLLIGQDVDNAVNKGGAIQFETADDTNDYGANVIGARTY